MQESGSNKGNITEASVERKKENQVFVPISLRILLLVRTSITHLPRSRRIYLALRKSAVMDRVDCKGVALPR